MAHNVLKTIALASGVSTTLLFAGFSSQAFAMSPFQASYQFSYNGKNMGSATRTLSKSGNNWTYVFAAKAGAIASATETSHFSLNGNNIISNNFSRSSKILVHNNTMSIKFNPNAKTINTKKDDKARSFAWKSGVLDELNAELQLREDLKASGLKSSYAIADAKEVESRRFVKQGTEKVKTSYGTFDTIKVVMKHDKPNRDTIFWLAPKLDYVPVKVSHQDGKTSYGLLLTGYKGSMN
ncbi:DUF3108 domain-containing protein [Acinetobacter terrae]|uniref:DUF3108 domain-containing protein n=1 Tax=Acinetobacter terrae TaxID=2731247 RepID=A0A241VA10_9GAMM|nr:DUF3108 domain-containing protein [Acinetobacter terrae]NNH15908.1 DUF3108 domain-containing protein [Acinetobacter terrae]NNH86758.1 DUF3108 domain-containing protein [Acinetobacter terrae]OAL85858.1 hypothetical protein AY608_13770 [Acinetobacter terrae]OTG72026.1 hypothetical protein B9T23_14865 [Acinetobacter terrae]TCB61442.1 DUF3108 domain-containing protein [Acinetobacter terrae]